MLVVDDAEDLLELVAYVLRDAGFVVRTAVNGVEALFAAYEMQPAVIVMDMKMPLLDGIEAHGSSKPRKPPSTPRSLPTRPIPRSRTR